MLSIGKLGAGQESYYLSAVAQSVEDYYLGSGEATGRWLGGAAGALGLAGEVEAEDLRTVLSGRTLDGVRRRRGRVPGFDLTFSAPKSVSVLYGLGPGDVSAEVVAAHDAAVAAALEFVERTAVFTRHKLDGALSRVPGEGVVAAAFRHRTSRAGDPQLHTHCLVANMVRGVDGVWGALDGRALYREARTAGFVYQAVLRGELTARLGVEWGPVRNGCAELAGFESRVLRGFSRRRAEIEAELERRGLSSGRASQAAALSTRRAKDYGVDPESLVARWWERAAELGLSQRTVAAVTGRGRPVAVDDAAVAAGTDVLVSCHGLTAHRASFARRDVVRGWCETLPAGSLVDLERLDSLTERLLRDSRVVPLVIGDPSNLPEDSTTGERRYSTVEMLAVERRLLGLAVEGRGARVGVCLTAVVDGLLAARPDLHEEQVAMVRQLCGSGSAIDVVVGAAGTGKTSALAVAREAWERCGYRVVGAALAARAARELQDGSGIASSTLAQLLVDLRRAENGGLAARSVLVVDEAAMADTRRLAKLAEEVLAGGGKLVLVGDHRQLPEVEAGGAFAALAAAAGGVEMVTNRRQDHGWERRALAELRAGNPADAVAAYRRRGRVVVADDGPAARDTMVADWLAARAGGERALMVAVSNRAVADLNDRARAALLSAGEVAGDQLVVGERAFGVGDEVLCLRNDRRLGVLNGTVATVAAVDVTGGSLVAHVGGGTVVLPGWYVSEHLTHAYAMTVHKAQGATVERTFVLGDDALYREAGYVALSRGRRANVLYISGDRDDEETHLAAVEAVNPLEEITRTLSRSAAQVLASREPWELPDGASGSLGDLWRARDAVAAHLIGRPARPSEQDLRHLQERLAAAQAGYATAVTRREAAEERAAAAPRWRVRPRRERRAALDAALRAEQRAVAALDRLTDQVAAADAAVAAAARWDQDHQREAGRLQVLDGAILRATRVAGRAAVDDPPAEVLAALGAPPSGPAATRWRRAAGEVISFHARWGSGTGADETARAVHWASVRAAVDHVSNGAQRDVARAVGRGVDVAR